MSRQTHSARPVGRMDAPAGGRQGVPNARAGFVRESAAAEEDWRHQAACAPGSGVDPELFMPIGSTGPALLQIEDAKAVCRRCPSIDACLAFALRSGQEAGVWGGASEDDRRALKRKAARARAKAAGLPVSDEPEDEPASVATGTGWARERDERGHFVSVLDSPAGDPQ